MTSFIVNGKKELFLEGGLYPLTLYSANAILSGPMPYERIQDSPVRFPHPH